VCGESRMHGLEGGVGRRTRESNAPRPYPTVRGLPATEPGFQPIMGLISLRLLGLRLPALGLLGRVRS